MISSLFLMLVSFVYLPVHGPRHFSLPLSAWNDNSLGTLSVDFVNKLLSLPVNDLDGVWSTIVLFCFIYQFHLDLSLANLLTNVASIKFMCLVNEIGEISARLIRREVRRSFQIEHFYGVEKSWLEQGREELSCGLTTQLVLIQTQLLETSLLLNEFKHVRRGFFVQEQRRIPTKIEFIHFCETRAD